MVNRVRVSSVSVMVRSMVSIRISLHLMTSVPTVL